MQGAARAPLERIMGIEPTFAAWEAAVLPMNYIRVAFLYKKTTHISTEILCVVYISHCNI